MPHKSRHRTLNKTAETDREQVVEWISTAGETKILTPLFRNGSPQRYKQTTFNDLTNLQNHTGDFRSDLTNLQNHKDDLCRLPVSTLLVIILFLLKRDNRAAKSAGVNSGLLDPILILDNRLSRFRLAL